MGSLTVSYGGNTIHTSSADETFTLQTSGKYASDDITLTGTDVTSMTITYGGQTIDTGTGSFTHKLLTSGKLISGDIGVTASFAPQAEYFITFSSPSAFSLSVKNTTKNWDGTLEYSTNKTSWSTWDGTTTLSSINNKLYIRGTGNSYITGTTNKGWVLNGADISCNGNIETLLDYLTVSNGFHPTVAAYAFAQLFANCTALISPPSMSFIDTSTRTCSYMFANCINLLKIPELPSRALRSSCYEYMFYGCTKIRISATQVDDYTIPYRIPTQGSTTYLTNKALNNMFTNTGGSFTGTPVATTTYYTSNTVV